MSYTLPNNIKTHYDWSSRGAVDQLRRHSQTMRHTSTTTADLLLQIADALGASRPAPLEPGDVVRHCLDHFSSGSILHIKGDWAWVSSTGGAGAGALYRLSNLERA